MLQIEYPLFKKKNNMNSQNVKCQNRMHMFSMIQVTNKSI